MNPTVSATDARTFLPAILDRVARGGEVTITRHGVPVAVVIRPDALRVRRSGAAMTAAATLTQALTRARRFPLPVEGLSVERADELVAAVRAGRLAR